MQTPQSLFDISAASTTATITAVPTPPSDKAPRPTMGRIVRENAALDALLEKDATIEVLASGFRWSEGPAWNKGGGFLLFSDIPRNAIFKWKEDEGLSLFMHPSGYTGVTEYNPEPGSNGLTFDAQGRLHFCEHGDRRVSRLEHGGGKRTVADNYQGKRLNSPNDLCFRSNGDLYFTDPPYGLPQRNDDPRKELDFSGVYRVAPNGELTLLTKELGYPNGLAFSPDNNTLYVGQSDHSAAIWKAYPVREDGTLAEGKIFADATHLCGVLPGAPDGFKIDCNGNMWATGPGGVHVYNPGGELLGRIETGGRTSNCAWGDDGTVLYITADSHLVRIRTKTKGAGWV